MSANDEMMEDAILAAATLLGSPGPAEPADDAHYMAALGTHFWNTVCDVRARRLVAETAYVSTVVQEAGNVHMFVDMHS